MDAKRLLQGVHVEFLSLEFLFLKPQEGDHDLAVSEFWVLEQIVDESLCVSEKRSGGGYLEKGHPLLDEQIVIAPSLLRGNRRDLHHPSATPAIHQDIVTIR